MIGSGVTDTVKKNAICIVKSASITKPIALDAPGFFVVKKTGYTIGKMSIVDQFTFDDEKYYILLDFG